MSSILRDDDISMQPLHKKTVAVIGYGSQAHAQAQNLRDSGVSVLVGLRDGSPNAVKAAADGLAVLDIAGAVRAADLVAMLVPDEVQPAVWHDHILPNLRPEAAVLFAHGFNVHFGHIEAPEGHEMLLLSPKGPGPSLRAAYKAGRGLPGLYATLSGRPEAEALVLAYAKAIGCGRMGLLRTTFREETETDLFGEQAVLCGGVPALMQMGFETLVRAGYSPEVAYFETIHEVKLIVDLIYERGFVGMREAISNTAEFGGMLAAERLVTAESAAQMDGILARIRSGEFAREFVDDHQNGFARLHGGRGDRTGLLEETAATLRRDVLKVGQ